MLDIFIDNPNTRKWMVLSLRPTNWSCWPVTSLDWHFADHLVVLPQRRPHVLRRWAFNVQTSTKFLIGDRKMQNFP